LATVVFVYYRTMRRSPGFRVRAGINGSRWRVA
jgi:hypothetical protein